MFSRFHKQIASPAHKLRFTLQVVGAVARRGYFLFHSGQQAIEHPAHRLMLKISDAIERGLLDLNNRARTKQVRCALESQRAGILA